MLHNSGLSVRMLTAPKPLFGRSSAELANRLQEVVILKHFYDDLPNHLLERGGRVLSTSTFTKEIETVLGVQVSAILNMDLNATN